MWHTLYGQKYWDEPLNSWIRVFHSDPVPQVYKIKFMKKFFFPFAEKKRLFWKALRIQPWMDATFAWNFIPARYSMVNGKWCQDQQQKTTWSHTGSEAHGELKSPTLCRLHCWQTSTAIIKGRKTVRRELHVMGFQQLASLISLWRPWPACSGVFEAELCRAVDLQEPWYSVSKQFKIL